jgi:hypothetical protein
MLVSEVTSEPSLCARQWTICIPNPDARVRRIANGCTGVMGSRLN